MFRSPWKPPTRLNLPNLPDAVPENAGKVGPDFCGGCLYFALSSTFTIAVTTLDLITDWLVMSRLHLLQYQHRVEDYVDYYTNKSGNASDPYLWMYSGIYRHVPQVFYYFCVASSAVYAIGVIWHCYCFIIERGRYKNKLDGVPLKDTITYKHGGEFLALAQLLLEDIPLQILLMFAEMSMSCNFVVPLAGSVFVLMVSTTCVSIVWKGAQVAWWTGCCGRRENYYSGCAISCFRVSFLFLLPCALAAVLLNYVFLTGFMNNAIRPNHLRSAFFDSIGSADWHEQEELLFITKIGSTPDEAFCQNFTIGTIDSVIHSEQYGFHKTVPCDSVMMSSSGYNEQSGDINCTFSITLFANPVLDTITYNHGYQIYNKNSLCRSAILSPWDCWDTPEISEQATNKTTNSLTTWPTNVTESTTTVDLNTVGERCRLLFSVNYAHNVKDRSMINCDYEIIHNESIPLSMCSRG